MLLCLMLCLALEPTPDSNAAIGSWKGYLYAGSTQIRMTLNLHLEDGDLKGTLCFDNRDRPSRPLQVRLKGDKLKIFAAIPPSKKLSTQLFFDGVVTGDIYTGKSRNKSVPRKADEGSYFRFKRVLSSPEVPPDQQG